MGLDGYQGREERQSSSTRQQQREAFEDPTALALYDRKKKDRKMPRSMDDWFIMVESSWLYPE